MTNKIKAGGIVINSKGEVAIITNNLGRQTFPKGSIEPGETLLDTARREIQEETGLSKFDIGPELGVLVRPGYTAQKTDKPSVIKHIHIYVCSTAESQLRPQHPDTVKAVWVSREQVASVLSWPEEADFFMTHLEAIDAYLAGR